MFSKRILFALLLIAILLGIGTVFYYNVEQWSYVDSFYFSTMTLTTIGFGDLVPSTDFAKIFTSFYALFGIGIMLYILSSVIGLLIFRQEKYVEKVGGYFDRVLFPVRRLKRQQKELDKEIQKNLEQEKALEDQEKNLMMEKKFSIRHERELKEQERKISQQERKIKHQERMLREQQKEMERMLKKMKK